VHIDQDQMRATLLDSCAGARGGPETMLP